MDELEERIDKQYSKGELITSILGALGKTGKDTSKLTIDDLAPVDEFHIRGKDATRELADKVTFKPGHRVLDVGCGLGGSARFLASKYHCRVTGLDLTQEYIETANTLAELVGIENMVEFRQGSALEMPFDENSFNIVWTEHAQMNIEDKDSFYSEIFRVLKPNGHFMFHDIFLGRNTELDYPLPWADDDSISFLSTHGTVRRILEETGFMIVLWEDKSRESLDWYNKVIEKLGQENLPPLGIHLLMGDNSKLKIENNIRNLKKDRIVVFQGIAVKPG